MTATHRYYSPQAGLPSQSELLSDRAVFTTAYAMIPKGVLRDITTSYLPFWHQTRLWVLARPMSGFAETFSHYIVEVSAGGGTDRPDDNKAAQSVLFVVEGTVTLHYEGQSFEMQEGGYAYLPAGMAWSCHNHSDKKAVFHWIRKRYEDVDGLERPEAFVTSDGAQTPISMPDTDGVWATTRFVDPSDLRHDMHVNIVTFQPGGVIPFAETHVMEHGLYILQGKAAYHVNQNWIEVEAGDYLWLRAFCPQACYAGGPEPFRYLLYKDVNRHALLDL
ncbi:MAG: bifunctional allantoicase/(S)-ureidoglycine aminohydrolase [Candidatus Puniceispirillaceae bacterium]